MRVQEISYSTLLMLAAEHNKILVIPKLIAQGVKLNKEGHSGFTALHSAARAGHAKAVELLVNHGADWGIQNLYGDTALHCAALSNDRETIEVLINKGASIHAINKAGKTPIYYMPQGYQPHAQTLYATRWPQWGSPLAAPRTDRQIPAPNYQQTTMNLNSGANYLLRKSD